MKQRIALVIALTTCAVPLAAHAQRKSPLADAPAIRHRYELRQTRVELGVGAAATLNQDFYNGVLANVRAGFHLTDWLSIAGVGSFAVANFDTPLRARVGDTLTDDPSTNPREPLKTDALNSMNAVKYMLGAQAEFTPFTGKYSLFGKLFAQYDFYLFAGGAMLNYGSPTATGVTNPCTEANTTRSCLVEGSKVGVNFGVGMHTFFNDWLALNVELRDVLAPDNPAGRDVNGDTMANTKDLTWTSHYLVGLNLAVFLPPKASVSP